MADKTNKGLPFDWEDDDRMNFMFSAFAESREVNPKHWDSKLHFWNKAILENCKCHRDVCIDLATLKRRFSRNGVTPLGISTVIKDMLQRGRLEKKVDFLDNCVGEGWLSWSYGLARRSFWWSVGTFWGENNSINPNEQFVLVDEAKENADWILTQHYECVECETTDNIIPWNVLKMRCKVSDDETLAVLLASLQKCNKAVLSMTTEGEKIVKFARKKELKVSPVSESDMDIVRLRKTMARLTVQVNNLSGEVENCRQQAARFVKEGSQSQALRMLKKKELRQRTLNKVLANLTSLEEILHRIQHANTNKMVIEALKSGTATLSSLHSQISIESVEDVMDDLNETLSVSQDIDTAISKGTSETSAVGPEELEELEKELATLVISDQDSLAPVQPVSSHPRPATTADYCSNSSSSRQSHSVTQEFDVERDTLNLPDVPSNSPNKTEILKSRSKAVPLAEG